MTFTIETGYWLIPMAITVIAFTLASWRARRLVPPSAPPASFGNAGLAMVAFLFYGAAAIISLIAWLIFAVLS